MAWGSGRKPYGGGNRSSGGGGGRSNFQKRNSGGGNFKGRSGGGRGKQQQQDRQWENITGLFPGKSGHSVFITDEILERLQALKVGDMLFVGPRKDSDMLNLSVMLGDDSEQGGDQQGDGN